MTGLLGFALALNVLSAPAPAEDRSSLSIHASSYSDDLKIHLVVTDPTGRRNGYMPFPVPHDVFEFPGGYGTIRMGDEVRLEQAHPESLEFNHGPVLKGTYTATFYGLSSTLFHYAMNLYDANNSFNIPTYHSKDYISSGTTLEYKLYLDPTPGAPPPVVAKVVTFDVLRRDLTVAHGLNQIGDDKFVKSFVRMIDLAEKLAKRCEKRRIKKCIPAVMVLKMFIKRLEIANRKCDKPLDCDEEPAWTAFRKEHGKDGDFKDFFDAWDKDEWHKWKKRCKRFVTDEALKIIRSDAEILIEDVGGEPKRGGKKHD